MPDDKDVAGVTIDEYYKDKEEFASTTDAILGADPDKSDEDIIKELDSKKDDETGTAGEATKDQSNDSDKDKAKGDDGSLFTDDQGDAQTGNDADTGNKDSDTDGDKDADGTTDWKLKFEESEAELKKERQKTSSWDGRIRAANKKAEQLAEENEQLRLQLNNQPDPDAESDKETLERFKSDFPELADVVNVLLKRVDGAAPVRSQAKDKTVDDSDGQASDDATSGESTETNDHMTEVTSKHPDLSEMVSSGVLLTWIQKQKPFMRPHLENIYYNGSSKQVIDMISEFKKSTGWKSQLDKGNNSKAKADKLASMKDVQSESGGAPTDGPDKNDFDGAFKEAIAEEK